MYLRFIAPLWLRFVNIEKGFDGKMAKITIADVANALGCSPQSVRIGLQRGHFPFGTAIKTSSKYTYVIYEKKLKEYIDF